LNQSARAVPHLKAAVQQEPGNKEALCWLGTALWDAGQTTAALAQLRKTAERLPRDPDVLFLLGEAYQKAANQELEDVTKQSIGTPLYHQIFGDIYSDEQIWPKASGHYVWAIEKNPKWIGAHLGLGQVYITQGKLADAKREFQTELQIDPSSAAAEAKLANIAILEGDVTEALRKLNDAIRIAPARAADALDLAPIALLTAAVKVDDKVAASYRQSLPGLRSVPETAAKDLALALVCARLGLADESAHAWQRYLNAAPRPAISVDTFEQAKTDFYRHNFEVAEQELEALTNKQRKNLEARYLLGRTYQYLSLATLEQMLAIDPDFYRAHELLAKTYERREEKDKALAEYRIVAQTHPELPGIHFAIGHLLWTMEEPDEALTELSGELRLNPAHPEANAELGTILAARQERDKAISYLQKALQLKPDLVTAREQLGMVLYQKGDYAAAEKELKRVLLDDPEGSAHFVLGMVYRKMGRTEESRAALEGSRKIKAERLAENNIALEGSTK
jgi:tetratricopeptide (TPR) repeat protein